MKIRGALDQMALTLGQPNTIDIAHLDPDLNSQLSVDICEAIKENQAYKGMKLII